jgi:hypothetical protein
VNSDPRRRWALASAEGDDASRIGVRHAGERGETVFSGEQAIVLAAPA